MKCNKWKKFAIVMKRVDSTKIYRNKSLRRYERKKTLERENRRMQLKSY